MEIIPAIDIKEGRCVRLRQGRREEETVFADDPLEMADRWVAQGGSRLHIVDLDGAASGAPVNAPAVRRIAEGHPDIPIQVGGGIRGEDAAQAYLDAGVRHLVIGTRAVREPHFVEDMCLEFPGHIVVGLDVKDGKVATDGWSKLSHHDAADLAQNFQNIGVVAIVFTDIQRDGMMQGLNVEATAELARGLTVPVIASGGVTALDDLRALKAVEDDGIAGVIIGRALYEERIRLADALAIAAGP